MFDRHIYPVQARLLQPLAARLAQRGISADGVTVIGFLIGMSALPLLATQHYWAALAAILANRFFDGLDGAIACCTEATPRGAFLDIAFDFVFYASVPLGFALADPAGNALAAAVLLFAFMGTASSFLAFAATGGFASTDYPAKGIYYLGGLTEGAETIGVFIVMCVWPQSFPTLALVFAALCGLTTVMRWWWGWRKL